MQPTMFDKVLEELRDPLTFALGAITIAATYLLGGLLLLIVVLVLYLLLKAIPVGEEGSAGFIVITRTLVVIISLILLAGNIKPDGAAPLLLLVASSVSLMRVLLSVKPKIVTESGVLATSIMFGLIKELNDEAISDIDSAITAAIPTKMMVPTAKVKLLEYIREQNKDNTWLAYELSVFPEVDWPATINLIYERAKAILATWQEPS